MKRVLRSILDFDGSITQDNLCANLQKLIISRLEWTRPDDKKVFDFVKTYFHTRLEVPAKATIVDYFEKQNDQETMERLKDIESAQAYIRTNFTHLVSQLVDDQNKLKAIALLQESKDIIHKGLTIEGEVKRGVRDGLKHFALSANTLITSETSTQIRGNLRADGEQVWKEYEQARNNKGLTWGKFTGLNEIDKICHGIKRGELWMHAAYAGELKTTFATTWCYNLITRYRTNVFYASLEMKYEHIRKLIYTIHTTNKKWELQGYKPLDYRKVRDGELTPEEEKFFQIVIEDFCTNPDYGHFDVWAPDDDVSPDDIRMEAELQHKNNEIGLLVVDHGGLVEPRKKKRNKDFGVELNSVIRDFKKLALHFNHGESIPLLLLFQINRQGKDEANKNEGRYEMKALAYANEAERSADIITTTYLNPDHRANKTTRFCNLKNRDNPQFNPFDAQVNFDSRYIKNLDPFAGSDGQGISVDDRRSIGKEMTGISLTDTPWAT